MGPLEIAVGGVAPGVVAGLILLAGRLSRKAETTQRWTALLPPLAVMLGFVPAYLALNGYTFEFWQRNGAMRFGTIILAVLAGSMITSLLRGSAWAVALVRGALFAGLAWIVGSAITPSFFSWDQLAAIMLGVGVAGAAIGSLLDRSAAALVGWRFPAMLLPLVALAAPAFYFNGYATGAQLGGGLIAIVTASIVAGVLVPRLRFDGGGVTALVALPASLVLINQCFVDGAGQSAGLAVLLGFAAPAIILAPMLAKRRPMVRVAAGAAASLVAGALAVGAAQGFKDAAPAGDPYGNPYSEYDPYAPGN